MNSPRRPLLKHGKVIPPATLAEAVRLWSESAAEVRRIEAQLADPARPTRYPTMAEFDDWKASAKRALALFRSAAAQYGDLVLASEHDQVEAADLFRAAYALLKVLEEDVDFEAPETALMRRLDAYFRKPL